MSYVPSAQTFLAIKQSILRYNKLKNDSEGDAVATLAIRSGLVVLASRPLKCFLATAELTLTSGENTVSVPNDFNLPFSLHVIDTNSKRAGRVIFQREEDFDYIHSQREGVAGAPTFYTWRGGDTVLEMDRAPEASYVTAYPKVRLRYYKRIDNLSTNTATFSIPPEVEEFLVWHGRKEVASIYDSAKYPLAQQEASRALLDLIRRETVRDEHDWSF